jgi:hypothetical protein
MVQDLMDGSILFKHESFHLWESDCIGLLCEVSKDFLLVSKAGMNVLSLGTIEKKRVKDFEGLD